MKIKWTKLMGGWFAERSDGMTGHAGWAPPYRAKPAGWSVSTYGPLPGKGFYWTGGGRFATLAAAKKFLTEIMRRR